MAGSTADVTLSSNALLLLGHTPIASFTEGTSGSQVASNLFENSYKYLLSLHRWRFATKQERLAKLSLKPKEVFEHQFQLPADMLYLIRAIDINNYEVYEDKLLCNHVDVRIEYVFNINSDKTPPYFIKMVEFYLASQFAIPITGDIGKAEYFGREYNKLLLKAKNLDSSQRPNDGFSYQPYVDTRF